MVADHARALAAHDAAWQRYHDARQAGADPEIVEELRADMLVAAECARAEAKKNRDRDRPRCPTCRRAWGD